jgi:hypothetical protein
MPSLARMRHAGLVGVAGGMIVSWEHPRSTRFPRTASSLMVSKHNLRVRALSFRCSAAAPNRRRESGDAKNRFPHYSGDSAKE